MGEILLQIILVQPAALGGQKVCVVLKEQVDLLAGELFSDGKDFFNLFRVLDAVNILKANKNPFVQPGQVLP